MTQASIQDGFPAVTADDVTDEKLLPGNFRTLQREVREFRESIETCLKEFMAEMRRDRADLRAEIALLARRADGTDTVVADLHRRVARLEKPPRKRHKRRGKKPRNDPEAPRIQEVTRPALDHDRARR